MQTVLFHYSVFHRGGAEKSTLRMMKAFLKNGWRVKLVLNFKGGTMENELPPEIKVEYLANFPIQWYRNIVLRCLFRAIDRLTQPFRFRKYKTQTYDLACIGLQGLDPRFVCDVVNARKKLIFIRNDISLCANWEGVVSNIETYKEAIDQIICVSGTVKQSVDTLIPSCAHKAKVVYNIIDAADMRAKLDGAMNPYQDTEQLKVVSVCRMVDKAKGLFRMLRAYDRLYQRGIVFDWYFVGDGADLPKMKDMTKDKPYREHLHFEGEKKNPFPYYKYADLVAVLSYYEGLCGIVNEAKVSGAAVIATEFSGIHEQLTHGENGWIVENDEDAIVVGLERVLTDHALREHMKNTMYPDAILNDDDKIRQILM